MNFDDIKTLSGKFNLINEVMKCENYFNYRDLLQILKNLFRKIIKCIIKLFRNITAVFDNLDEIYKICENMNK